MALPPFSDFTERQAFLALNAIPGVGPSARRRLLWERFPGGQSSGGRAALLPPARPRKPRRGTSIRSAEEAQLARAGGGFSGAARSRTIPPLLQEIPDPPSSASIIRAATIRAGPSVAIVGTRWASPYGREVAGKLAGELCHLGFCVVSGLALGIDTAAGWGGAGRGTRTDDRGPGLRDSNVIYPPGKMPTSPAGWPGRAPCCRNIPWPGARPGSPFPCATGSSPACAPPWSWSKARWTAGP